MTNHNEIFPAHEGGNGPVIEHDPNENPARRRPRTPSAKVGIALAALIGISAAVAQADGPGGGSWGGSWGGFAERRIGYVLDKVDATREQEDRIFAILERARGEIRPSWRDFRDIREQVAITLSSPTIDRSAVEKLRAERVGRLDEASRKAANAFVQAAEVLTPEQRAKLAAELNGTGFGLW